ncbi:ABC transporter permease [Actinomadura flavalba]|uniref:ABC transporter permease n=1 Tax=Actinomadura flavalba TaxID=1120938 RepID=UPI000364C75E|nr:ABC transporter permease [Actinomadura flavalba]
MSAAAAPAPAALLDGVLLAGRHLRLLARRPGAIIGPVLTPLLFAALFFGVFQNVMARAGVDYAQYLLPAVIVQAMFFNAMAAGLGGHEDAASGMLRRLRGAPVARSAPLTGWLLGRTAVSAVALVLLVAVGHLLGFRFHGGAAGAAGFAAVALLLVVTLTAGYLTLALRVRSVQAFQVLANLFFFPFLLLSSAFSPARAFPEWLRPVVEQQPVSRVADLLRALASAEGPSAGPALIALGWLTGLLVLFLVLGARAFGRTA